MLRNLRFQSKLLLVLMVPVAALAAFSALGIRSRLTGLDANEQFGDLQGTNRALAHLGAALEDESISSSWAIASRSSNDVHLAERELANARRETDAAVEDARSPLEGLQGDEHDATADAARELADDLDGIERQREQIDGSSTTSRAARDFFLGIDDHVLEITEQLARELDEPSVSTGVLEVLDLHRVRQETAREAGVVVAVLATDRMSAGESNELYAAMQAIEANLAAFYAVARPPEIGAFDDAQRTDAVGTSIDAGPVQRMVADLPSDVAPSQWIQAVSSELASLDEGTSAVGDEVADAAHNREVAARDDMLRYAAGALGAIAAALLVAWAVTRSTTRPLQRLTRAARRVSQRQLPQLVDSLRQGGELDPSQLQPIEVSGAHDEIGDLEQAFNAIQTVTVDVAREQAALLRRGISDLFVNLARRNQSLLDRQIELIDRLEADEEDPEVLKSLFRLDHLATRMRRNAESLLVLAGTEQQRRWRGPIPLIDVVRAASAEIADFDRVTVTGVDHDLAVTGSVAADLTHVMAELLENATAFSPPVAPVEVAGRRRGDSFVITVTDEGLGMSPERLAEANALLADPPVVGLALSRILGLFVVGHLAVRHGIRVVLRPGEPRGLTAVVMLPADVLATAEPRAASNGHGQRALMAPERPPVVVEQDEPAARETGVDHEPAPEPDPTWDDVDSWVAKLVEDEALGRTPADLPQRTPEGEPTIPTRTPLRARVPGDNLFHLPVRGEGPTDVGREAWPTEPERSRAETVRQMLSDHRRGIERADTRRDDPTEEVDR